MNRELESRTITTITRCVSLLGRAHGADQPMTAEALTDGQRWALVFEARADLWELLQSLTPEA